MEQQIEYKKARKRLEPIIGREIDSLTVDDLQNVVNSAASTFYTARAMKTLLSHLYKRAMASNANQGRITQNLSEFIVLPKLEEEEPEPFTPDEVATMWKSYSEGNQFVGYALLMVYTGMMPTELMSCEKTQINLDTCEIVGAGAKTKVRKKSAIVFPESVKPLVEDLLQVEPDNGRANKGKLICVNKDNFYKRYYAALELAGVRKLPPYSCRHTYGTEAVKLGVHPAVIQKMLRHSNQKTQERYTHLTSEAAHEAANLFLGGTQLAHTDADFPHKV